MKIPSIAGFALAFTGILFFQSVSTAAKPTETRDKVSYSIGADIGGSLKTADFDLNPAFLTQGIQDAFGGKLEMTEEEMKATLDQFRLEMQAKMQAKMQALAEKNKAASEKFLEENKTKKDVVTTSTGLQYRIIKAGTGPKAKQTDTVMVLYKGSFIDGKVFDESKEGPVPFDVGQVIPGMSEAFQLMPVGSKWQIFIPPALAYGEPGRPGIEPNQTLIFELEIVEIKAPEKAAEAPKAS